MRMNLEEALLNRWSGLKIMRMSLALGLAAISPLLLYILLGPKDGNPIGLGLLAIAGIPFAAVGFLTGFAKFCVERVRGQR